MIFATIITFTNIRTIHRNAHTQYVQNVQIDIVLMTITHYTIYDFNSCKITHAKKKKNFCVFVSTMKSSCIRFNVIFFAALWLLFMFVTFCSTYWMLDQIRFSKRERKKKLSNALWALVFYSMRKVQPQHLNFVSQLYNTTNNRRDDIFICLCVFFFCCFFFINLFLLFSFNPLTVVVRVSLYLSENYSYTENL